MSDRPESLIPDLHRIIGSQLSREQLEDLIELNPVSTQRVARFFQVKTRVQLKKGQASQILQVLDRARARAATPLPSIAPPQRAVDPDLATLATPEGQGTERDSAGSAFR